MPNLREQGRKVAVAAAFAVPILILLFGGEIRHSAWLAALGGMVALNRADVREVGSDVASRLSVTEEWRGRFVLLAGVLGVLLTLQGMAAAEEARVLRKELEMVCDTDDELCDRLNEAQAMAGMAGAEIFSGGQSAWGYGD